MGKAIPAQRSQVEALERIKKVSSVKVRCSELGLELSEVYLVGSKARGDYLIDSGIDVILVVKGVENLYD